MIRKIFLTLLLIASSIVGKTVQSIFEYNKPVYRFHLPWACAVLLRDSPREPKLVGPCAIFTADHVLVSVDNFRVEGIVYPDALFLHLNKIFVNAGTNIMNGTKYKQAFAQKRKVVDFFIGKTKHLNTRNYYEWDEYISQPITYQSYAEVQKNVNGVSYNVGILKLESRFAWTVYVRPITMNFLYFGADFFVSQFEFFKRALESEIPAKTKCITYSWNEKLNKIRYHEVMYIQRRNCIDLFCSWDLKNCEVFPNETYHNCFKSTKYADVCPNARGAALYCPAFSEHSVFAILTSAPSCGLNHMPGVYTSIDLAIRLYQKIYPDNNFFYEPRPDLKDVYELNQRNEDYEGIY